MGKHLLLSLIYFGCFHNALVSYNGFYYCFYLLEWSKICAPYVEAMSSKVILMMPKNQESSKIQRFKNQDLRFKNQVSWIKIQESSRSRFKTEGSRNKGRLNQDKYKKSFPKYWVAQEVFTKSLPKSFTLW